MSKKNYSKSKNTEKQVDNSEKFNKFWFIIPAVLSVGIISYYLRDISHLNEISNTRQYQSTLKESNNHFKQPKCKHSVIKHYKSEYDSFYISSSSKEDSIKRSYFKLVDIDVSTITKTSKITLFKKSFFIFDDFVNEDSIAKKTENVIAHFKDFANTSELNNKNVNVFLPHTIDDIIQPGINDINMYYIAHKGVKDSTAFSFEQYGREIPAGIVNEKEESVGSANFSFKFEENTNTHFRIGKYVNGLVFVSTHYPEEILDITIVSEYLHKCIQNSTARHIKSLFGDGLIKKTDYYQYIRFMQKKDELFVHAATFLWFKKYNKDSGLNISDEAIDKIIDNCDNNPTYNGVKVTMAHIDKIGVGKAIEMYNDNPNNLFTPYTFEKSMRERKQ
ncbi:MAG: hypothetical protein WC755_05165 [Candidatus Woesearchaeota archaeon]|jgi:hypothetical protein